MWVVSVGEGVYCGVCDVFLLYCAGDSGEGEEPTEGDLVKESDETFVIWCSGRVNCAGMMVHMQVCVCVVCT